MMSKHLQHLRLLPEQLRGAHSNQTRQIYQQGRRTWPALMLATRALHATSCQPSQPGDDGECLLLFTTGLCMFDGILVPLLCCAASA